MIELGISKLVQSDSAVKAIAKNGGGWLRQLPKGQVLPSWTYATVSNTDAGGRTLTGVAGLRAWRGQIDCYAESSDEAVRLSQAIAAKLNGYRGTLPDPDATIVDSAFVLDVHDPELDEAGRTWRRVLEIGVHYVSQF
jgi:hypothetical protein